jgi:hypothetical protein
LLLPAGLTAAAIQALSITNTVDADKTGHGESKSALIRKKKVIAATGKPLT